MPAAAPVLDVTREDRRVAALAALGVVIHLAEAGLPSPLPGLKPGLANVVVLAALALHGWRAAAWVSLLRVLAGSLLAGTFLTPTFVLSLSGALAALAALGLVGLLPGRGPGPVGAAVAASLAHMGGQFAVAYALFLPHPALLHLLPVLMSFALAAGVLTGLVALAALRGLERRGLHPLRGPLEADRV